MVNIIKRHGTDFSKDIAIIRGAKVQCVRCGFNYPKNSGNIYKVKGRWICRWDIDPEDYRGVKR